MDCPRCGSEIKGLACERCTRGASERALWEYQETHLEALRAGQVLFAAVRPMVGAAWHLLLFGDAAHAYCGEECLRPAAKNRTRLSYRRVAELKDPVCARCFDRLRQIEERAALREA